MNTYLCQTLYNPSPECRSSYNLLPSTAAPVQMKHAEPTVIMGQQVRCTLGDKNGKKDLLHGRGGERWSFRSVSCSCCYQWLGQHEGLACCPPTAAASTPETMILPSKTARNLVLQAYRHSSRGTGGSQQSGHPQQSAALSNHIPWSQHGQIADLSCPKWAVCLILLRQHHHLVKF